MSKPFVYIFIFIMIISSQFIVQAGEVVNYILGAEDVVEVSVWNHAELSRRAVIRPDGFISLPLVGEVKASGSTPVELADRIQTELKKYINNPIVTVAVVDFKLTEISILGAVSRPGVYKVKPNTRLLEVLALAGLSEINGHLEEVSLTRNHTVLKVNVDRLLREGGHQNFVLQDGDVIFVPQASRQVYILGEVVRAGAYTINRETTPADVLAMAGGPTKRADLQKVQIIRKDSGEAVVVNLKNFLENKASQDPIYLQAGDIIQVLETKSINWERVFTFAAGIKVIRDLVINW